MSDDEDNEFVSAGMMDRNLLEAKDVYRKEKGLLTSKEIKQIRKKYGLTQAEIFIFIRFRRSNNNEIREKINTR